MFALSVKDSTGRGSNHNLDRTPDTCPICHRGIQPVDHGWSLISGNNEVIERVFVCPLRSCQRLFIARYHQNMTSANFYLSQCVPAEPQNYSPPAELKQISPDFCAIYNEAHKAEQLGLLLVSGPGYRKALEFLIKDYLTSVQETDEAKKEIAELPLMACVREYVTDSRMRATSERAAWLGNDETHYIRKWEDKDLQDLKKFITLTCFWIQSEHLTNVGVAEMPQGKK
jgi:hypothetical protein